MYTSDSTNMQDLSWGSGKGFFSMFLENFSINLMCCLARNYQCRSKQYFSHFLRCIGWYDEVQVDPVGAVSSANVVVFPWSASVSHQKSVRGSYHNWYYRDQHHPEEEKARLYAFKKKSSRGLYAQKVIWVYIKNTAKCDQKREKGKFTPEGQKFTLFKFPWRILHKSPQSLRESSRMLRLWV